MICHDGTTKTRGLEIAQGLAREMDLPSLREVLIRYQRTAFLDIELKVVGLEAITADLLRSFTPVRGFVVSSFLPEVVEALHSIDVWIPLGLICENPIQLSRWVDLPVEYVIPHYKLVREEFISEMKAAGKKILVWTVNSPEDMKRFTEWGVDGIISDNPKLLALTLSRGTNPKRRNKEKK